MRRAIGMALLLCGTICCFVRLDAPCGSDDFCPPTQYCLNGRCHDGPLDPLSACQRVDQTLAARGEQCGYGPADLIAQNHEVTTVCASILASVDAGRIQYDSTQLDACRSNLSDAGCSLISVDLIGTLCPALQPKQLQGQLCGSSNDCIDGWCDTSAAGTPAACEGQCRPSIHAGNPCGAVDRCEAGTTCVGSVCVRNGTGSAAACNALNLGAAPCDFSSSYCDLSLNHCSPRQAAGNCNVVACLIDPLVCACDWHSRCVGSLDGGMAACQPARLLDAGCDPGQYECEPLTHCPSGPNPVCVSDSPLGGPCGFLGGDSVGCIDSRCVGSTCSAFLNPGDHCTGPASSECGPSAHCDNTVCKIDICP